MVIADFNALGIQVESDFVGELPVRLVGGEVGERLESCGVGFFGFAGARTLS